MSHRLEDYALIGDGESVALICRSGSIDWMCWPRFDSDACFAALLGNEENSHWSLAPAEGLTRVSRAYRGDSLILETEFVTLSGAVRVVDFMPIRSRNPVLVRVAIGQQGSVSMRSVLRLRFGYGVVPPWIEAEAHRAIGRVGPDMTVLDSDVPLACKGGDASARFVLAQGERRAFVLQLAPSHTTPPPRLNIPDALADTEGFWRGWIRRFEKPSPWPDAVRRSLITIKALIDRPTGGIVGAPTTSLPEVPGGEMNWDYRYCWLRDASFTISALLNAGYHNEAKQWRDWLLRAIAGTPEHVQIMYRLDGARYLNEWIASWLQGFRWSSPVRVGNSAAGQRQLDVFGELIDVLSLARRSGIGKGEHATLVERAIVQHVEEIWRAPGHGIWELRGKPRQYVYSKVMAWAALDRFVRNADHAGNTEMLGRMKALRTEIHQEVCREGFSDGLNSFVEYYGGQEPDASLLLMPVIGFLPADDPRIAATIDRIERELMEDGLVYRTPRARAMGQGAFLACNCWLADCRRMQGRNFEAHAALERLLDVRNDVGLLAEEYDVRGRHLSGNFPQALSHVTLITSALGLSGALLERRAL